MEFLKHLNIEVIHSIYYFQRVLFLLKINDRYTMIYKGSGLNGGRVGKILPFFLLLEDKPTLSDARHNINTGYIWKEFYFNR